ncbi:unnamed protein product [Boreogadus saida]
MLWREDVEPGWSPSGWESLANAIGFPNDSYRNMGAIYIYCNCFWCSLIVVQNYITDMAIAHTFCIEEVGGGGNADHNTYGYLI